MDWHTMIAASITFVPFAAMILAARIGSRQMREFHMRTGDDSLLVKMTAFSRFRGEDAPVADPAAPAAPRRRRHRG